MLKKFTPYLAISVFLAFIQSALPGTKLEINAQGDLNIISGDNQTIKTLPVGSVGEVIVSDNQQFKLSYGKDLQGSLTIIIYPAPEQKQALSLSYANSDISISPDAVLTITKNNSRSSYQSGVLGEVTVDGRKVSPSSAITLGTDNNARLQTPVTSQSPNIVTNTTDSAPATSTVDQSQPNTQTTEVKFVWGNAYISKNGAPEIPLHKTTEIKAGDSVRTGDNGELQISFFPHTFTALDKGSKLTIKELYYSDLNNNPQRKLLADLESGNVYSKINTHDIGHTEYVIKTPVRTFKAVGTSFSIQESNGTITVSVIEGTVTTDDGTPIPAGYKDVFTANGEQQITQLSQNEMFTLGGILSTGAAIHLPGYENLLAQIQAAVNNEQQTAMPRLVPQPITPVTP